MQTYPTHDHGTLMLNWVVRKERLELSRLPTLVPKTSASTNSATFAYGQRALYSAALRNACQYNALYNTKAAHQTESAVLTILRINTAGQTSLPAGIQLD